MMNDDDRKNKKDKSILDMIREKREREALEQGKDPNVIEIRAIPNTDGDLDIDHPKNKAALDAFHQNDDENNKPQKKIKIFNNKDGTYNRKDFVDDELVNEEFIDHRLQHNYGKSSLRNFLENLNNGEMPNGWRDSPIGKRAYSLGYEEGYDAAAEEYERTLDALRRILELEAQREY